MSLSFRVAQVCHFFNLLLFQIKSVGQVGHFFEMLLLLIGRGLPVRPQHGEDPPHHQPDGVEEKPSDEGENHLRKVTNICLKKQRRQAKKSPVTFGKPIWKVNIHVILTRQDI